MTRRARRSKRRSSGSVMDAMVAYARAQVEGCRGVVEDVTVDDLFGVHMVAASKPESWGWAAFDSGAERPCEVMRVEPDPFDGTVPPPPGCGAGCLFGGGDGDE